VDGQALLFDSLEVAGARLVINHGASEERLPASVRVDVRVRGSSEIIAVAVVDGGFQVTFKAAIDVEGGGKPVMAAELLYRYQI
jgi:hypothetical protein